jgi:pyridoxal phosphate enzyme (YggS family)
MNIQSNLAKLKSEIPDNIKIVAVSKTKSCDEIMQAYNFGHKIFGENKVQELVDKYESLPKDIEWHFIGHLQSNKVKFIAPFVNLIHGIESYKLLAEIDKRALQYNRIINCLLQIHIAKEDTKFGFSREEVIQLVKSDEYNKLKNIRIIGLMGMATYTYDDVVVYNEFNELKSIFQFLKENYFKNVLDFTEISMGMSGDYKIALKSGTTIVRIGSYIFGDRK